MSTDATLDNKGEGKPVYQVCGERGPFVFESVYYDEKPMLLVFHKGTEKFMVADNLTIENVIYLPFRRDMYPYRPYSLNADMLTFLNSWIPSNEEVYNLVYPEFDTFLDLHEKWKILEANQSLETYQQNKIFSTSYPFHYGEMESGKTVALKIHNALDYRPLLSPNLPAADVYTFLGYHEEGCGTILEDEAERLDNPRYEEKMKLYRAGYTKGAKIPRIEFTQKGTRTIRFFNAFCCKLFSGKWLPKDSAFQQRLVPIHMAEGSPKKDEFEEEDFLRFDAIKTKLLAWRMRNYFNPLPQIEMTLHGRLKELWKPKFQVAKGLSIEKRIWDLASEMEREKDEERRTCFEAFLTKAVLKTKIHYEGNQLPFNNIWDDLRRVLGAEENFEDPNTIESGQFGPISKHLIGLRLQSILGAKRLLIQNRRTYLFDEMTLQKLMKKYKITLLDWEELR